MSAISILAGGPRGFQTRKLPHQAAASEALRAVHRLPNTCTPRGGQSRELHGGDSPAPLAVDNQGSSMGVILVISTATTLTSVKATSCTSCLACTGVSDLIHDVQRY